MAKKAVVPSVDISDVTQEYLSLSARVKLLESRKTELSNIIKEYSKTNGVKDANGSFYSKVGNIQYGAVAKKSVSLNREKAETYFKERDLWQEVVLVTESIDESKVEALVSLGTLDVSDLETITDIKTSYSVSVKEVESEVVEQEIQQQINVGPDGIDKPRSFKPVLKATRK